MKVFQFLLTANALLGSDWLAKAEQPKLRDFVTECDVTRCLNFMTPEILKYSFGGGCLHRACEDGERVCHLIGFLQSFLHEPGVLAPLCTGGGRRYSPRHFSGKDLAGLLLSLLNGRYFHPDCRLCWINNLDQFLHI
jgi:hypothetical protein